MRPQRNVLSCLLLIAMAATFPTPMVVSGKVRITGSVQDAHDCGDSVTWFVDHLTRSGLKQILKGAIKTNGMQTLGAAAESPLSDVSVRAGDFIQLAIMPKTNHGCDLTQIDLTIEEVGGKLRWNLAKDIISDFSEGNPQDDQYDNPEVWYFYQVATDRGETFGKTLKDKIAELASEIPQNARELAVWAGFVRTLLTRNEFLFVD